MKRFHELTERLSFNFKFTDCLFLNYRIQSLKYEFCITYVLCHLLFCSRSPNSGSQCRLCSQLFVENTNDFVQSIKYHFSLIFLKNKIFSDETELFVQSRKTRFNLDVLNLTERQFKLVNSKQNCCMSFLVAKHPCDIIFSVSEVCVRILINHVASFSNDLLTMSSDYGSSIMYEKRVLFLDSCANFIRCFSFDLCKLLGPSAFF